MNEPIEIIAEDDVSPESLARLFRRAYYKVEFDPDGDVVVHTDGPRVTIDLNASVKVMRLASFYGLSDSATILDKHALANRMNDEVIVCRFTVPEARADILLADYYLSYEGGVPAYQIVACLRLFARIVPDAIRACDEDDLVE